MEKIMALLVDFTAGYPQIKISQQTLVVYAKALAGYKEEDLKKAMLKLLRTRKDFPSVAEICQAVSES